MHEPVINDEVALIQVFVVGQDQSFMDFLAQVAFDPAHLVAPGAMVLPGGGGEDVNVEMPGEGFKGPDRCPEATSRGACLACAGPRNRACEGPNQDRLASFRGSMRPLRRSHKLRRKVWVCQFPGKKELALGG